MPHDYHQHQLSPRSALFSRSARRKAEAKRPHAALVEAMQKGPPKRNGAAQPDSRRQALAAAIERVREVEAELEAARLAVRKKQQEGWEASAAIQAAKGIAEEVAMAAMNDYNAAAKQQARDAEKRYLEDAEAKHAQWIVDRELGRPVGEEPPTAEQIKRKVEAAEAKVAEIDGIRARLEAEVRQRESDLASEQRKLNDAVGRVLLPAFVDLIEYYRDQQDQLARVKQHLSVLSGATVNVRGPEQRFWDSIHDDPPENTSALRDAIAKLSADADADVGAAIEALKEGATV